jgi:uncharacterized protein
MAALPELSGPRRSLEAGLTEGGVECAGSGPGFRSGWPQQAVVGTASGAHAGPVRSTSDHAHRLTAGAGGWRAVAARRPLAAFLILALGIGWCALGIPVALGVDYSPFLLVMLFLGLLAPALLVTRAVDGRAGVRRLFARAFLWRFGLARWLIVLGAMPVLTLSLAAVTGTLVSPPGGWVPMLAWYLFNTVIFGALLANLWEETAWAGFVQTRLMARYGLLASSLLTAVPFALIHVPMYLAEGTPAQMARNLAILFALAPVYRYLLGMHLLATGGSVLAVGIQHAAWNASGKLEAVEGDWQVIIAVIVLTAFLALARAPWRGHRPDRAASRDAQRAAAARWLNRPRVGEPVP